jgi:hypothetical protein
MSSTVQRKGELKDSYSKAIQEGYVEPDEDDAVIGVVRKRTPWFADVDENCPSLAPDPDLLDDFHDKRDELEERDDLDDVEAHNKAAVAVNFRERYHRRIQTPDAKVRMDDIESMIENGRDVWLICYESDKPDESERKFCHRRILKGVIESRMN